VTQPLRGVDNTGNENGKGKKKGKKRQREKEIKEK
jgi:hypothetical protein